MSNYKEFLWRKSNYSGMNGFSPLLLPDYLFDFQKSLVDWSLRKGRCAIFADCGMGKTIIELVWAQNIVQKTNKSVLLITPLAVSQQTVAEGAKFGIECRRSRDGERAGHITVTNYERLHLFSPEDYVGIICDESSILKHFGGATQKHLTRFASKLPYRLLCTATAAPNDYIELGTSSEALGELGHSDMLTRFFNQNDKKKLIMNDVKLARTTRGGDYYAKLSYRASQSIGQWQLKPHAEQPFWRWVCSWARACRKPSDLGFDDSNFILPKLIEREHCIVPDTPPSGMLFTVPAFGLAEERDERRRTMNERCELVARLVDNDDPAVVWCHLNDEGDALEGRIPGAVQVKGANSDDFKERAYEDFASGKTRVLITKPKIGAWGLNWQHCSHVVTFASHSYEQFYQSIRRCWRFGQMRDVVVDIIATTGERHVRDNMIRKAEAANKMFANLVAQMNDATRVDRKIYTEEVRSPQWLSPNN